MQITIPEVAEFHHRADIQIRFSDVDVLGHVNNTNYFSFYDTGKALYFSEVTGQQMEWSKIDRVIANIDCAFIEQIVYGEDIEVLTRVTSIGTKSFAMQQMLRNKKTGAVKSVATTIMVTIDPDTHKTVPVSEENRRALEAYEGLSL